MIVLVDRCYSRTIFRKFPSAHKSPPIGMKKGILSAEKENPYQLKKTWHVFIYSLPMSWSREDPWVPFPKAQPQPCGPCNLISSSIFTSSDTQVLFLLCISSSKTWAGRVKHLSNPRQGPPHRLQGNNGAISLYLTFAPAVLMTYSSPPGYCDSVSITLLPEHSWPSPNILPSLLGLLPSPFLTFLPSHLSQIPSCLLPHLLVFPPPCISLYKISPPPLPFSLFFPAFSLPSFLPPCFVFLHTLPY